MNSQGINIGGEAPKYHTEHSMNSQGPGPDMREGGKVMDGGYDVPKLPPMTVLEVVLHTQRLQVTHHLSDNGLRASAVALHACCACPAMKYPSVISPDVVKPTQKSAPSFVRQVLSVRTLFEPKVEVTN